jgi:hypothetical protein
VSLSFRLRVGSERHPPDFKKAVKASPLLVWLWNQPHQSALLRLDARLSNHLRPFRDFCPELGSTLFGRIADRLETQRSQPLLHIRQRDELDDLLMEFP